VEIRGSEGCGVIVGAEIESSLVCSINWCISHGGWGFDVIGILGVNKMATLQVIILYHR